MRNIYFLLLCILCARALRADSLEPPKKKTICLNMIVKNESLVIEKCLASVKPLIDYWVIVDTGSTDGTQERIKAFMKDIPGELHERPWVNFEHNRNEALQLATGRGDYLLMVDADEIFQYADNFHLPTLEKDTYYMVVRQLGAVDFKRATLINAHLHWKWEGVLHEVLVCPEAKSYDLLTGVMNICNANAIAAGRSTDPQKYLKDATVFEKALKKEPNNSRYVFYLAQSYYAAKEYKKALKNYQKRVEMPSEDAQETFFAIYNVGKLQEILGDSDAALKSFFKAHEYRPSRAEPLLHAAVIYRKQGNFLLGYLLTRHALSIPYPGDTCVEYITYDYALLVEFANCALLSGKYQEGLEASCKLLANPRLPQEIKPQVVSNCEFAKARLGEAIHMVVQNPNELTLEKK